MADNEQQEEHEDELRLWAELRPGKSHLVLTIQHNCYDELEMTFTEQGEAKKLLLAKSQWKLLKSFLKNNR